MWDTHFFFFCKKTRKNQQPTPIWLEMAFCCPKPLVEQQISASHSALARVLLRLQPGHSPLPVLLSPCAADQPLLSPASPGACPHHLSCSSSTPHSAAGYSPSPKVTIPGRGAQSQLTGLQRQLTLLPVASRRDFFPCAHPGAAGGFCAGLGMVAAPLSSATEDPAL